MSSERLPVVYLNEPVGSSLLDPYSPTEQELANVVRSLPQQLPHTPKAILLISSGWSTRAPTVTASKQTKILYDYAHAAPKYCFDIAWNRAGAPGLARRVEELLKEGNIECSFDSSRGLDHRAFIPLLLGFTRPDSLPISTPSSALSSLAIGGGAHHHQLFLPQNSPKQSATPLPWDYQKNNNTNVDNVNGNNKDDEYKGGYTTMISPSDKKTDEKLASYYNDNYNLENRGRSSSFNSVSSTSSANNNNNNNKNSKLKVGDEDFDEKDIEKDDEDKKHQHQQQQQQQQHDDDDAFFSGCATPGSPGAGAADEISSSSTPATAAATPSIVTSPTYHHARPHELISYDYAALEAIPVVEMSILSSLDTDEHLALGAALRPLRDEGVLIIGVGNAINPVADLGPAYAAVSAAAAGTSTTATTSITSPSSCSSSVSSACSVSSAPVPKWARSFDSFVTDSLTNHTGDERKKLISSWQSVSGSSRCQLKGAEEGLMPLLVCAGAADDSAGKLLFEGWSLGMVSLSAFIFGQQQQQQQTEKNVAVFEKKIVESADSSTAVIVPLNASA